MGIKSFEAALLSALMLTSIAALAIPLLSPVTVHAALTSHAPIYINGNSGFTKPDPVNGGGSGTENDPYIMKNWDISAVSDNGIEIRNTTAYFIIRNCLVENGGGSYEGIYLENVTHGKIENCICSNNSYGIYLSSSSDNNILDNNTCRNNTNYGIWLHLSSNYNNLTNNTVRNNYDGIDLDYSFNNTLTNNTCDNSYYGIIIYSSSNNNLTNNSCYNNWGSDGIQLDSSSNNTLTNNSCDNNYNGISLYYSDNNHIYHNNFVNNSTQAYDDGSNYWDNGYPSGGNYWSDYTRVDDFKGENQNIPGGDGIGDAPCNILGGSNRDHYPLMRPWSPPCRGTASLGLATSGTPPYLWGIRKANVTVNLTVNTGDNLHLIFLQYDNKTVESENVIWSRTAPGAQTMNLSNLVVQHPGNLNVKRAKLVLTDNFGNVVLDNMAWYKVVKDDWGNRIVWNVVNWASHNSSQQDQLGSEISQIILNWASTPTVRDQHDFSQS